MNAFGDVVNPEANKILAGTRDPETGRFLDSAEMLKRASNEIITGFTTNTTIGVIATNALLPRLFL